MVQYFSGVVSIGANGVQLLFAKDAFQRAPVWVNLFSNSVSLIPHPMSLSIAMCLSLWGNAIVSSANAGSEFNKKADEILSDPNAIGNMMMYGF